ncbi:O-antigen ligase family protein [Microbacterium aurum]|uniref:O-antigen ligase family protein n=1 Tax=Microbacterium aurum TaxID=36805 RepID=UPI0028E66A2B|nr:O-antigen ligase family protein [Microbacterium aurum]
MTADTARRPDAVTWLLCYVVVLYGIPSRLVIDQLGSAGAPSMLFGLASFAGWALFQIGRTTDDPEELTRRPVRVAAVIFLLCVGASYLAGMIRPIDSDEVSPADVALLSVLSWCGVLLLTSDGVRSLERLRSLARGLAWVGGLLAILGLLQFATNDVLIDRLSIPGLRDADFEVFSRGDFIRPSGTATHPIEFGLILTILLPIALHVAYTDTGRNVFARWAPVPLLAVTIALTFSRSAYVSVLFALLVLLIGWPAVRRRGFLIGFAALVAALFVGVPRLFGTIGSLFRNVGNDPSIASRTNSYDLFWEFFANAPFFGRGLGTFLPKYRIFDNQYLMLLVGVGVIGTLAFVAVLGTSLYVAIGISRRSPDPVVRDLALSGAASVAAGAVGLATFDGFAFPMTMGSIFLIVGMIGAIHHVTSAEITSE